MRIEENGLDAFGQRHARLSLIGRHQHDRMTRFDPIAALDGGLQYETIGKAPLHPLQPEALVLSIGIRQDDATQRIGAEP